MNNHPGKAMTIYDIPGVVRDSLPLALNPANIMSGYKASGICPFNADIFQDSDFAPSYVTDRPNPIEEPVKDTENLTSNFENPEPLEFAPKLNSEIICAKFQVAQVCKKIGHLHKLDLFQRLHPENKLRITGAKENRLF